MSLLTKFKSKFENIGRQREKKSEQAGVVKKKEAPVAQVTEGKKVRPASAKASAGKDKKVELKDSSGSAARVIIRPMQTEKVTDLMAFGKYTFLVTDNASKNEIKKAIHALYGVVPRAVHVINMRGKRVRFGRVWSKRKNWRKAIVTLKAGDSIEVFEGV